MIVTPNNEAVCRKTGDVEVLQSKDNIPFLYPDAPRGKSIFQPKKSINLYKHDENLRSKSKSKYEQFLDNIQQKEVQTCIEEPKPTHQYCNI